MEDSFFKDKLSQFGIKTVIPGTDDRDYIHNTIINELTLGIFTDETKKNFCSIIDRLKSQQAEGVILGCTEIPMLVEPGECSITGFDTTFIHAKALADFAVAESVPVRQE